MNNYLVTLTLILGEYEKTTRIQVEAVDKEEAGLKALRAESHNDDAGFEGRDWWDCDGQYVYRVSCVTYLTPEENDTLTRLFEWTF